MRFVGVRRSLGHAPVLSACAIAVLIFASLAWGAGSLFAFFSLEGLLIVGGGVVATAFMSFEADDVRSALDAIRYLFRKEVKGQADLHEDMTILVYCAKLLKEKGMRNLEAVIAQTGLKDPFIKYGFNMAVSQYAPEDVRAMMETAAEAHYERESLPVEILQAMASHAPAFGMIGTLVGMVAMLSHLNGDISMIGSSLAVSFLSTLYGVISARLIYMPAASKLKQDVDQKRFRRYLITEGMVMLVSDKPPMFIQDRLNSFLRHESYDYVNVLENDRTAPSVHAVVRLR